MKSEPRGPTSWLPDVGMQARVPGAQVGDEEGVLVVVAGAPQIGLAEDGDSYRPLVIRASFRVHV